MIPVAIVKRSVSTIVKNHKRRVLLFLDGRFSAPTSSLTTPLVTVLSGEIIFLLERGRRVGRKVESTVIPADNVHTTEGAHHAAYSTSGSVRELSRMLTQTVRTDSRLVDRSSGTAACAERTLFREGDSCV